MGTLSSRLSYRDIEFTELQSQYTNLQGQYSRVQSRVEHLERNSDTQYVQGLQQEINRLRQNFSYAADQLQQRSQEFNFPYDFHFHQD